MGVINGTGNFLVLYHTWVSVLSVQPVLLLPKTWVVLAQMENGRHPVAHQDYWQMVSLLLIYSTSLTASFEPDGKMTTLDVVTWCRCNSFWRHLSRNTEWKTLGMLAGAVNGYPAVSAGCLTCSTAQQLQRVYFCSGNFSWAALNSTDCLTIPF